MSFINKKKFETLICNIDRNSYRAYQNLLNKSKIVKQAPNKSPLKTNSGLIHNTREEKEFIYPFGQKEKRFKWMTEKSGNLYTNLEGKIKQYNVSNSEWDGMNNRSNSSLMRPVQKNVDKRNKDNSCSFRTVDHLSDRASATPSPDRINNQKHRTYLGEVLNRSALSAMTRGDIPVLENAKQINNRLEYAPNIHCEKPLPVSCTFASLMDRTQNSEKKIKKFSGQMLANSSIFIPENYNYRKQKRYVSIEKEKKDYFYAGNKSATKDEIRNRNVYVNLRQKSPISNIDITLDKTKKNEIHTVPIVNSSNKLDNTYHSRFQKNSSTASIKDSKNSNSKSNTSKDNVRITKIKDFRFFYLNEGGIK